MNTGGDMFRLGIYIDDIILVGSSDDRIKEVKDALFQKFEIKDMGKLHVHHFLIVQDEKRKKGVDKTT
jgi:hypothetical protein